MNTWGRELWTYRELFYSFVLRDLKVKYKQSLMGVGWAIIQPLFAMIIFTLFFGRLAKIPSDGYPYPLFSYAGLLPWTYFAAAVAMAGNSVVMHSNMVRKVYFPRVALPMAAVLSHVVDMAVAGVLLVGLMVYYGVAFSPALLVLPLLVVALIMLTTGVGMFFAALNVRYRDVKFALPFIIQLWMFATPVIYPLTMVPEPYRPLFALNPLAGIIDAFRACVFPAQAFDVPVLAVSLLVTSAVFISGTMYFKRTERWFADVI